MTNGGYCNFTIVKKLLLVIYVTIDFLTNNRILIQTIELKTRRIMTSEIVKNITRLKIFYKLRD